MAQLPSLFSSTNRDIRSIRKQMDRFFEDFFNPPSSLFYGEPLQMGFSPTCDVEESDSHYLLSFDLPGVKKDDIHIQLENGILTVSGERKEEKEEKMKRSYRSERFYGGFSRSFSVPGAIDPAQIQANYSNGVLELSIPKTEESKSHQIQIQEKRSGASRSLTHDQESKTQTH